MNIQEKRLIDLLEAKRREDPEGFRKYLPGVAELMPESPSKRGRARPVFGLTEQDLSVHRAGLSEALGKLGEGAITVEEAVKGLQHCANLIRDDNLPDEAGYEVLKRLVKAATGKSPGSYRSKTTVSLGKGGGPALEQVPVIRGVYLDLDRAMRLVSVSVNPGKIRERSKLMAFVGASKDPEPDVSSRHDDYLAMQDPHGNP